MGGRSRVPPLTSNQHTGIIQKPDVANRPGSKADGGSALMKSARTRGFVRDRSRVIALLEL